MVEAKQGARERGDVEVALDALQDGFISDVRLTSDGGELVFVSKNLNAHITPPLNPKLPEHVEAKASFVEPDSFAEYIKLYKTPHALAFASLGENQITARLDYHQPAAGETGPNPQPNQHHAFLKCPYDLDYAAWKEKLGESLSQVELAEFIEDMIHTILKPTAAELLEAIADLKVERGVKFRSAANQADGTVKLTYEEEDQAAGGGNVKLPREFTITVPIFQGGPSIKLIVRLRYRISRGSVVFVLAVSALDREERTEFRSIGDKLRKDTGMPVFYSA